MSWGNTATGTAAQVKEQASFFAAYVAQLDEGRGAPTGVKVAHQAQATGAAHTIGAIVDSYPEGTRFTISVSASAPESPGGTGYLNLGYGVTVPAGQPVSVEL